MPLTPWLGLQRQRLWWRRWLEAPPARAGGRKRHRFHPWSGRPPEEGTGNPTPVFLQENPMDRAWQATVHRGNKKPDTSKGT